MLWWLSWVVGPGNGTVAYSGGWGPEELERVGNNDTALLIPISRIATVNELTESRLTVYQNANTVLPPCEGPILSPIFRMK